MGDNYNNRNEEDNFERDFYKDVGEKKKVARGIHNRASRTGRISKVMFPADFLVGRAKSKYIKSLSGEVVTTMIPVTELPSLEQIEAKGYSTARKMIQNFYDAYPVGKLRKHWGISAYHFYNKVLTKYDVPLKESGKQKKGRPVSTGRVTAKKPSKSERIELPKLSELNNMDRHKAAELIKTIREHYTVRELKKLWNVSEFMLYNHVFNAFENVEEDTQSENSKILKEIDTNSSVPVQENFINNTVPTYTEVNTNPQQGQNLGHNQYHPQQPQPQQMNNQYQQQQYQFNQQSHQQSHQQYGFIPNEVQVIPNEVVYTNNQQYHNNNQAIQHQNVQQLPYNNGYDNGYEIITGQDGVQYKIQTHQLIGNQYVQHLPELPHKQAVHEVEEGFKITLKGEYEAKTLESRVTNILLTMEQGKKYKIHFKVEEIIEEAKEELKEETKEDNVKVANAPDLDNNVNPQEHDSNYSQGGNNRNNFDTNRNNYSQSQNQQQWQRVTPQHLQQQQPNLHQDGRTFKSVQEFQAYVQNQRK